MIMKKGFEGNREESRGFERVAIERVREALRGLERVREESRGIERNREKLSKPFERLRAVSKRFSANPVFGNPVHPALD